MIDLAAKSKIITIAQALKCASSLKAGKTCSQADMKATILLLDTAVKTARRNTRQWKELWSKSDNMVTRLLGKVGL